MACRYCDSSTEDTFYVDYMPRSAHNPSSVNYCPNCGEEYDEW